MSKIVYKEITSKVYQGKESLTVDQAKDLIGYLPVERGQGEHFTDKEGNKIKLTNNPTNRPFRPNLATKWMLEMLRGKWELNGEPIVVDRLGHIQSGQHRLVGFIWGSQLIEHDETWAHLKGKPYSLEIVVVCGVHERTADTLDLGQKRSLGDILYRRKEFSKDYDKHEQKHLAQVFAVSQKLLWLRLGGKDVSHAPHFPPSEALELSANHPRLRGAVEFIHNENSAGEGSRFKPYISEGYASALLYLMGTSSSESVDNLSFDNWEKAEEFWVLLASGENLSKDSPILSLRNILAKSEAGSAKGRDTIVCLVAKAWNAFLAGEPLPPKNLKVKERVDKDSGKRTLAERPTFGGIDYDPDKIVEEELATPKSRKRTSHKSQPPAPSTDEESPPIQVGDTVMVGDESPFEATVLELKKKTAIVEAVDGETYNVPLNSLHKS